MNNDEMFEIECSDEESYFDPETIYRQVNGKRVWEPKGETIAELYKKIESNGCFVPEDFDWKNPGRILPSQLEEETNTDATGEKAGTDLEKTEEKEKTEFDFDNDFDGLPTLDTSVKVTVKNRTSQVLKKPTTDVSAVVRNLKKYQQQ